MKPAPARPARGDEATPSLIGTLASVSAIPPAPPMPPGEEAAAELRRAELPPRPLPQLRLPLRREKRQPLSWPHALARCRSVLRRRRPEHLAACRDRGQLALRGVGLSAADPAYQQLALESHGLGDSRSLHTQVALRPSQEKGAAGALITAGRCEYSHGWALWVPLGASGSRATASDGRAAAQRRHYPPPPPIPPALICVALRASSPRPQPGSR